MGKLKLFGLLAVVIALSSFNLFGKFQDDKDKDKKPKKKLFVDYDMSLLTESELRYCALATAMPVYPERAATEGVQGLVHVAVMYDENGEYLAMKVLESPHPALSKAVSDALKQWRIKLSYNSPYPETRLPNRNFAEVYFHFVIRDGIPAVEPGTVEEQSKASEKFIKISGPSKDPENMSWR